jgi:hypothetical protein
MAEYKDSTTALIADVDCTTEGKALCTKHGVRGYPSIKWGDPNNLEDYEGGRSFKDLKKFAETNLGPQCGPANMDLCDEAKAAQIKEFQALSSDALDAAIKAKTDEMEKLETDFKEFLEGLQKQYKEESDSKDAKVAALKDSGLGLMKSVLAHKTKNEL